MIHAAKWRPKMTIYLLNTFWLFNNKNNLKIFINLSFTEQTNDPDLTEDMDLAMYLITVNVDLLVSSTYQRNFVPGAAEKVADFLWSPVVEGIFLKKNVIIIKINFCSYFKFLMLSSHF